MNSNQALIKRNENQCLVGQFKYFDGQRLIVQEVGYQCDESNNNCQVVIHFESIPNQKQPRSMTLEEYLNL